MPGLVACANSLYPDGTCPGGLRRVHPRNRSVGGERGNRSSNDAGTGRP